jgi:hypothetical protein
MRKLLILIHLRWLRWLASDAQYNVDMVCQGKSRRWSASSERHGLQALHR